MVPADFCDMDPRGVLATQVERLAAAGQNARRRRGARILRHAASADGNFSLVTPPGLSADPERPMTFGFEEMDTLGPFIDDVYRIAEAQGLPVDAVMQDPVPGSSRST